MPEQTKTFVLTKAKECKHTTVYESADEAAPASSIYIKNKFLGNPLPASVEVTITVK